MALFMQLITNVMTPFVRTRPHPQSTFRLPTVGYANGLNTFIAGGVGRVRLQIVITNQYF